MLASVAVATIQRRRSYRQDKAEEILLEMNLAQERLEAGITVQTANGSIFTFLPWFLITEIATAVTTINEERLPIPSGFIQEFEPDALWYFNANAEVEADKWQVLIKDDLEVLRDEFTGTGPPKAYALVDDYFRILPLPDGAYSIKQIFYKRQPTITVIPDTHNNWLFYAGNLIIAETLAAMTVGEKEGGLNTWAKSEAVKESLKLFISNEAREHANRRYVMGGGD